MKRLLAPWVLVLAVSCGDDRTRFHDDDGGGGSGASGPSSGNGGFGAVGGSGGSSAEGGGPVGGGGAGGAPAEAACDAPAVSPSNGACVILTDEVECNPVTNEPCSQVCGNYGLGLFQCYTVTNMQPVCGSCDDGGVCGAGTDCLDDLGYEANYTCAKYCCDDGDCGSGVCVKDGIGTPDAPVGVCLQP